MPFGEIKWRNLGTDEVADGDGEVRKEHSRREELQERAFQNTPQNNRKKEHDSSPIPKEGTTSQKTQ